MKHITSSHNEILKDLRQLATSAKHRRRNQQTLLEGIHLCKSYLEQIGTPHMYVYTDSALHSMEVTEIVKTCEEKSVKGILLGEKHFREISNLENGVGIVFVITTPTLPETPPLKTNSLLLETIQDPGNLGTVLRTAAAAGIQNVYLSTGSVGAWSPKVTRAGMGAHFALRIYENCDLSHVISSSEMPVLATSLKAKNTIYQQDLSQPVAWLFGNEGKGVSNELLSLKVTSVVIPQNSQVESLNVAASVAVCLFEQARQLKA